MTYYVPGTEEKDPAKVIMSLQQAHTKTATNATDIATNTTNIATNTTNIATNTTNIASNTTNIASNTTAITNLQTAGQGLVNSGGSLAVSLSRLTASLGADVALNNAANFFDGPSVAQGTTGTWFASGKVTCTDTAGVAAIYCKLWDGTTVIDSGFVTVAVAGYGVAMTLSGYLASPAGNLRISVRDLSSTSGKILFNQTGTSKDSTISAVRIA